MNENKKIVRLHAENHSAEALGIIFAYKQKGDHLVYSMYQGESVSEQKIPLEEWVSYEHFFEALNKKKTLMYELQINDKRYVVNLTPLSYTEKPEIMGHCVNITSYQEKKEQIQPFIYHNADAVAIVDLEGKTLQVNPAFENTFGWTFEEIYQKPLPIIPSFLKEPVCELHKTIQSGESKTEFETVRQHKDGHLINVSVTLFRVENMNDWPLCIAFVYRDITSRKQDETALKESEQRYRSLIELSPEAIIVHSEGKIDYINPAGAKALGYKNPQDVLGACVYQFVHPDYYDVVKQRIYRMKTENKSVDLQEEKFIHKDGYTIDAETIAFPIPYMGKQAIQVLFRDITERKKTEKLLRESAQLSLVGQLAAGIAHEIRNPLTAVKGFMQLLKETSGQPYYVEMINHELDRIELIADEFLSLAKPQAKTYKDKHVQDILENTLKLAEVQGITEKIHVKKEIDLHLPLVLCEENQLKQVFSNIFKNAVESMPSGGTVTIQLKRFNQENLVVRFSDEGPGITQERMQHLGKPFYSTKEKGTGLGLMVCYKIIREHRGEINFVSELGKGTTVDILLPFKK
ncbi:PAS domain-containing sensor histidine kinase [Priestia megaterium]|uniref:PAS domain-containing sensor histidine kinase n=1 Tax=Priestia megaterium TaxID=1404 RepID=UPI003B9F85A4